MYRQTVKFTLPREMYFNEKDLTMMMTRKLHTAVLLATAVLGTSAFAPSRLQLNVQHCLQAHKSKKGFQNAIASAVVASTLTLSPLLVPLTPAVAYEASDYASETVTAVVDSLKSAGSNTAETFKTFETIAAIITEGKGVGGSINYEGVQLNRGYIADEDTAIYNPGLTLLTESEKERLVEAIINSRKAGVAAKSWNDDNQVAYEFLKEKLDPLHMNELRGYLGILPFYGAALYLGILAVQQSAREFFPVAYMVGVALAFGPMLALVAIGPQ